MSWHYKCSNNPPVYLTESVAGKPYCNICAASPGADWLPTGGKRPDFPDGTQCFVRDMDAGELGPRRIELWQWGPITHYRLVAPLPAQPAEGEWFGMGTKPPEGIVVESRHPVSRYTFMLWADNKWFLGTSAKECHDDRSNRRLSASPHNNREWRYPPGERTEATINAGPERAIGGTSPEEIAASESSAPAPAPKCPFCGAVEAGHSCGQILKPAAPQRQNLALWLALRGRAPWPEAPRVILSSLPVNSYKRHPK